MRLRRGETVLPPRAPPAQTPGLPFRAGDHLRRPRGALGCSAPYPHADCRTRHCGCADHHGTRGSPTSSATSGGALESRICRTKCGRSAKSILENDFAREIQKEHDVFLSHTGIDKAWVRTLGERLEQEGIEDRSDSRRIKVFFDEWDIDYGENIVNRLNEGLRQSRYLVAILSPEFLESSGLIRSGLIGS